MKKRLNNNSAFSLVEVTMALAVAVFCLVSVFGLLPVGITTTQTSIQQTAAANIARAIISDLRTTPVTQPASDQNSPNYKITIPATAAQTIKHTIFLLDDGTASGAEDQDAVANTNPNLTPKYRATLIFTPSNNSQKTATQVRILITWPAMADRSTAATPTNFTGSYETFTALDRN
jgi:Tfp pilus assembly protein PilV